MTSPSKLFVSMATCSSTVKLTQFLLREKFCHVKLHAVQIESVVFAAIGPGVLLENLRAGVFDIKVGGLFGSGVFR